MPVKLLVDSLNSDGYLTNKLKWIAKLVLEKSANKKIHLFEKYIDGKSILDIGLGTGQMAKLLLDKNYSVTGIDVTNTSLYPEIQPIIYDGENFPFKGRSIDLGLLICVLHHCKNQEAVLKEAMRVCKKLIIIEDTYRNEFERLLVAARDSIGNSEFYHHDYHSTKVWLALFKKLGWKSGLVKEWSSLSIYGMYGRQSLFVIEPKSK